jgi:hypothetical protein
MLGRLNHVAIAVKDAEKAAKIYGSAPTSHPPCRYRSTASLPCS